MAEDRAVTRGLAAGFCAFDLPLADKSCRIRGRMNNRRAVRHLPAVRDFCWLDLGGGLSRFCVRISRSEATGSDRSR
jgi:hypothetical protein